MECPACGEEFDPIRTRWLCPKCGLHNSCCEGAPLPESDTGCVTLTADLIALAAAYDAGKAWQEAVDAMVEFIPLVVKNNPGKPLSQILLRPDVQDVMVLPFARAGAMTQAAIYEAWQDGAGETVIDAKDLTAVVTKAKQNAATMPIAIRKAMFAGPREEIAERLAALGKKMRLRAELAVQHAGARAKVLAQLEDAPPGATKTWHSLDWPNRCSYCLALDGVTIPVNAAFDVHAGGDKLKAFGVLLGPPRHPHCRCHLTISMP